MNLEFKANIGASMKALDAHVLELAVGGFDTAEIGGVMKVIGISVRGYSMTP